MSWLTKVKAMSNNVLTKLVTYYDDGSHYKYDSESKQWYSVASAGRIVITSRRTYRTSPRKEPITETKALRKFLSRDAQNHVSQFVLGKKDGTTRTLTQYVYKQAPSALIDKTGLVIPESLLLANSVLSEGFYQVTTPTDKLFVSVSDGKFDSARAVGLSVSEAQARNILGVSNTTPLKNVPIEDCSERLFSGILKTLQQNTADVFVNKHKQTQSVPYGKLGGVLGGVFAFYIAASSGYLTLIADSRSESLNELGGEVEAAMNLESEVKAKREKIKAMQELLGSMRPPLELWQLFQFLTEQDVTMNNISVAESGVELNVNAGSMTRLFESLNQQAFIKSVEFTTSVRRNGGEETATLQLELGGEGE